MANPATKDRADHQVGYYYITSTVRDDFYAHFLGNKGGPGQGGRPGPPGEPGTTKPEAGPPGNHQTIITVWHTFSCVRVFQEDPEDLDAPDHQAHPAHPANQVSNMLVVYIEPSCFCEK